jgi:hypothetical protein
MRLLKRVIFLVVLAGAAIAQSLQPPLSETRLTIHTLVREDLFAGFLADDMERLTRGEKSVAVLLEQRPGSKAELLAWSGGAAMYRAVKAFEANRSDEFRTYYQTALDRIAEAQKLGSQNGGVAAVVGGTQVLFADRLPKELRAAAWSRAYDSYQILWQQQATAVDKLPLHLRGELLGGLAQSAQRTGRTDELAKYLDKIIEVAGDTPYGTVAKKWKSDPASAASSSITCMSCHDGGRLSARMAALK